MAADKEIMKAIERLRLDRPGRHWRAANEKQDGGTLGEQLIAALCELATTFREEAELWSKSGAKGWKSSETEKYLVAQHIDDVAAQLDNAGGGAALSVSVPQTGPATTHERLDDFVASAAAAGKGTLRPDASMAEAVEHYAAALPPSLDRPIPVDLPGATQGDVAAYLKGDVDTLPGLAEALVPGSVTDSTTPPASAEDVIDAETRSKLDSLKDFSVTVTIGPGEAISWGDASAIYCSDCDHDTHRCYGCGDPLAHGESICAACKILHAEPVIDLGPVPMPKTWESDTLTADGHVKPGVAQTLAPTLAPTLGQPGDMGTGYSHTYVPAGGRAVTFAELLTPVPMASLPPHLSHSQTNTVGDCATKYRLQRVEPLPQIPQWANIGGTAFHACAEHIERMMAAKPGLSLAAFDVEATWKHHFEGQITAVAMTTPVPQSVWRAARKGAEGEQWWRVNGPLMLRRYLDARPDDVTWAPVGELAIELDRTVSVPTPYGPVPFNAKIDRVTISEDGRTLTIRDYKTSYERPTDATQLGDYAWVLALAWSDLMAAGVKILGSYFDARRGEWTTPVDLLAAHPFEAFQYRVTTAHAQKLALTTGPTPARPSSYCGGCAVRYACPVMAAKS